jgi:hypothetical protein
MVSRTLTGLSLCSAVVAGMLTFSAAPVSAFTLSSPSLEPSFANSQIENAYYYYYHRYYHPYYYHRHYYHPYYHYYHPYYHHYYRPYYHHYYHPYRPIVSMTSRIFSLRSNR